MIRLFRMAAGGAAVCCFEELKNETTGNRYPAQAEALPALIQKGQQRL